MLGPDKEEASIFGSEGESSVGFSDRLSREEEAFLLAMKNEELRKERRRKSKEEDKET